MMMKQGPIQGSPSGARSSITRLNAVNVTNVADLSGLKHLTEDAKNRAKESKVKQEKVKVEKCGSRAWTDVLDLAEKIREGKTKWEDLDLDDVDIRFKWAGLFHRSKKTPGKFMMRVKAGVVLACCSSRHQMALVRHSCADNPILNLRHQMPNGELDGRQLRFLGDAIAPYGENGCADITTRAAIQLRGIPLVDADVIIKGLWDVNLTSFMTGMDNVRNLTGNPIAGVDPHELIDTRPILREMQDMITNKGVGREDLTNLPRKINVCISSTRDDFPHTQINDIGFEAVKDPELGGKVVFNLVYGGYFSIKRNIMSIPAPISVTQEQIIPFTEAMLKVFRDFGPRADRQQSRLIWLVEQIGMDKWIQLIEEYMGGGVKLRPAVKAAHEGHWERRDLMGVHPQKQPGLYFVGMCVPAGRMQAQDLHEIARLAETYGDGTVRLTCEENVLLVNVPESKLEALRAEPLLKRFQLDPGTLTKGMVTCTGSQFCGFALTETKNKAISVMEKLDQELELPKGVRIHFTGCPNSCGQAQVGDIGLMGAPAKKDGKACEGFKIFTGGEIGENPELAKEFAQGIPAEESILVPKLREILISEFGAKPRGS